MSLSLEDLKGELRENYTRIEEVFSSMDNYVVKLERRIEKQDKRIEMLEGQLASIAAAFSGGAELENISESGIVIGRP